MSLLNHFRKNKKTIGVITVLIVTSAVLLGVLPSVFASVNYYMPDVVVELDGTNDGTVTIGLNTPEADDMAFVQGTFDTMIGYDMEHLHFTLTEMTTGGELSTANIKNNTIADGLIRWSDWESDPPVHVSERGRLLSATYTVDKDTPAGNHSICLRDIWIASEISDWDTINIDRVCAQVTVTRNDAPAEKPAQVVTFRDSSGNPITGLTQWYGDTDIEITKEVTTGDGAITDYHPDDDGTGRVAHTDPSSDMVGFGEPGSVEICAWVAETETFAATKACYTVEVTKRPISITGATITDKTFDGTTDAEVTAVTFSDLGNGTPPTYTAEGTFGTANAGADKAIRVDVTLTDEAVDRYTLSPSYYNTTKTIEPFGLVRENVELVNGDTYTYDPDGVEPEVRVAVDLYGGRSTLVENQDYEVSYSDNMGVGTGHVTVTGIGNFVTNVPVVLDFTIDPQGIRNDDVIVPSSIVEGRILNVDDVTVNVNGRTLTRCATDGETNCDYVLTISGDNDGEVGHTVHVAVNGRNNYDGAGVADVDIVAKLEQTVTIADVTNTTVNKSYGDESFSYIATSTGNGDITYRSTAEAVVTVDMNTGEVSIVGVGDADIIATAAETDTYAEGSAKYTVHVDKKVITVTNATVADKTFDNTPVATVSDVTLSEGSLVYDTDYTATALFNDVDVAIRSVEVMVALTDDNFANYCFMHESSCVKNTSYSATAAITPFTLGADNATADLTANSFVYNGSEKTPGVTVKADLDGDGIKETTLASETDYDMSYENNVNRGTGSATVSGKGNYAGSLTGLAFEIIPAPVENVVVTAPSQDYTGEALEPVPTVTGEVAGLSMTFNAGDYYVISHAEFKNAGSYTFSVKSVDGGNYYFDSTDGSFTINKVASGDPAEMTAGLKIAAGCTLAELGERTVGFAWTNPDTVVGAGNQTFPATYLQNDDSTNYTPITVDVPVYGLKRLSVVTAIMGEGGEVTNPGDLAVEEDELTWTISPDEGYELESFVINSEDKTSEVSGGRFTMIAGTDNVTAIVRFRKVYEVINGAGQTHIRGVDGAAEFEIDAEYELFEDDGKVYVDGELLDPENYDSRSGSTIITLSEDYLNSLTLGEHALAVVFADDGIARTTFIIADPEAEDDNPAAADTGVFTGATGGAIATGASVMVMGALVGAMFFAKKNRKE